MSRELRRIRRAIDAVDQLLSAALALRAELVVRAALLPGKRRDRIREAEILAAAARRPTGGLRPAAVRRIFRAIIDAGIELQASLPGSQSGQGSERAVLHDRPASSRSARSLVVKKR